MEIYLEDSYNVSTFSQPTEALSYLKQCNCSLLILDIFMPEMDGLKFIQALKQESNFEGKILMCSGGGESGPFVGGIAIDAALGLGADDGITKPFTKDELLNKIQKIIHQRN